MSNPSKGFDESKQPQFPSAPSQTLTPEMKKIMDQMRMFFDPTVAMSGQGFPSGPGDQSKTGQGQLYGKGEAQGKGQSQQKKDTESVKSDEPKNPEIPDILKLFTDIDIPLTKENKKLFLGLYLHGLLQAEKQAKDHGIKDFAKELRYAREKIEEAIKDESDDISNKNYRDEKYGTELLRLLKKIENVT